MKYFFVEMINKGVTEKFPQCAETLASLAILLENGGNIVSRIEEISEKKYGDLKSKKVSVMYSDKRGLPIGVISKGVLFLTPIKGYSGGIEYDISSTREDIDMELICFRVTKTHGNPLLLESQVVPVAEILFREHHLDFQYVDVDGHAVEVR